MLMSTSTPLKDLVLLFLKLGATAFGGPAAHIAMMEEEVVRRRGWLLPEQFLDLLGATNLIPGPNSTEMAIHIGHQRAGWAGLLVAGICFILPAACIVTAIAWAYVKFGTLPQTAGLLYGVKPVIIAVVLQALWGLGRTAVKTKFLAVIALSAAVGSFLGARPAFRSNRCDCRDNGSDAVRHMAALSFFPQGRFGPLWQRLCALGVSACRSGGALEVADGSPAFGRHCCWAGDAGAGLHDRDFHWLPPCRALGRMHCYLRDLSACVLLCGN
jgi:chromate transport protein ChrA